ncbi:hypothetical protein AB0O69_02545 [Streptomyces xiamenensis]|uniref:hypothetical protein n=1 Tax=Streptomyces xiamenensis TaxID=408015 RepID=UPI0034213D6E
MAKSADVARNRRYWDGAGTDAHGPVARAHRRSSRCRGSTPPTPDVVDAIHVMQRTLMQRPAHQQYRQ